MSKSKPVSEEARSFAESMAELARIRHEEFVGNFAEEWAAKMASQPPASAFPAATLHVHDDCLSEPVVRTVGYANVTGQVCRRTGTFVVIDAAPAPQAKKVGW